MIFRDIYDKEHELPEGQRYFWRPAVYLLVIRRGKLLCITPKWSKKFELPGGGVNLGENLLEGGVRETFEETGFKVEVTDKKPVFVTDDFFCIPIFNKYYHGLTYIYKAEILEDKQYTDQVDFVKEVDRIHWIDIEELNPNDFANFLRDFVKEYFDK